MRKTEKGQGKEAQEDGLVPRANHSYWVTVVVVLTAVDRTADSKDLRDLIREQRLESLRIAPTPPGLMEKFGAYGHPNTLIIDEKGFVRIEQLGGGPGISHYLMAGLDAMREAEPQVAAQRERQ